MCIKKYKIKYLHFVACALCIITILVVQNFDQTRYSAIQLQNHRTENEQIHFIFGQIHLICKKK